MSNENCFWNRQGVAESAVHGYSADRNLRHELYRRNYLRDSGKLRGKVMERKPDTPVRKSRRKYEERNRDERKQKNKVWGTSIDRQYANKIDAFLLRHNLTKVELIVAGYHALMQQVEAKNNRQSPSEQ